MSFRTNGLNLGAALGTATKAAVENSLSMERYLTEADAYGVTRKRALEILDDVMGRWAGSTPTPEELDRARARLVDGEATKQT